MPELYPLPASVWPANASAAGLYLDSEKKAAIKVFEFQLYVSRLFVTYILGLFSFSIVETNNKCSFIPVKVIIAGVTGKF